MTDERPDAGASATGTASPPPPPPPPAASWAPPPPAPPAPAGRTGLAAAAGVMLLVLGILGGLLGLFVAVVGGSIVSALGDVVTIPELGDTTTGGILGGMVAFFGIVVVIYSLAYVFAGIGIVRSRNWGRVLGLIVGILSGLIWLGGLGGERGNLPFTIVMLGIHVYVVVVLLMFWRPRAA